MGIIKESKEVDFIVKSKPWSAEELKEFRKRIKNEKSEQDKIKRLQKKSDK